MSDNAILPLWPAGAPGAIGTEAADQPAITHYPASAPNGAAVVICPGGGYGGLAMDHEGDQIARWFNNVGVTAFVLRYRHAPRYRHPSPLQDAQRALRTVRTRAGEWGIDSARIGILGFSAGGHLTSTAATHFDAGDASATDPIDRASCRPDFAVLCYPVIALDAPYAHVGSRHNLLGPEPAPELVAALTNDRHITVETPPCFLFHTDEDAAVPPENSIDFYRGLRRAGIPAELHIFRPGVHGVGFAPTDPILSIWPQLLENWLRGLSII